MIAHFILPAEMSLEFNVNVPRAKHLAELLHDVEPRFDSPIASEYASGPSSPPVRQIKPCAFAATSSGKACPSAFLKSARADVEPGFSPARADLKVGATSADAGLKPGSTSRVGTVPAFLPRIFICVISRQRF